MAATPGGNTAVAMITYLGDDAETNTTYRNGLALALYDASSSSSWCSVPQSSIVTCLSSQYSTVSDARTDIAGIANTETLINKTHNKIGNNEHKHYAANAARNYGALLPTGTSA